MARITPTVRSDRLFYQRDGQDYQVVVGTPDWYAWLTTATSFAFRCPQGSFTARRERSGNKRGGWYWKAYAKRSGKLLHAYLGKAETLTFEHMSSIAAELTLAGDEHVQEESADRAPSTYTSRALSSPIAEQEGQDILHTELTDIIGREQETKTACLLLQKADVRLLTITGPAGVGKTRLALHVANVLAENFGDGVRCVSLAAVADPQLVVPTIAQELGFVEAGEAPLFARLKAFLRDKRLLLLLDNFEQIIEAAPLLTELLSVCPFLKILVTSREVLHIRIEHELMVPPLALPDLRQLPDVECLSQYAAVALFVRRALAVKPDFQVTPVNAQAIAEICTRLDGLPLAIELAAARIKLLSPQLLLTRLQHRLQVLTGGARDLPRRQQTLRDTLTWSYDLLDSDEQRIFRSFSVFVRGCTLEAAEEFCRTFQDDSELIFRYIASLIDKNLLQRAEQASGEARLMMLETVREYAQECLVACNEAAEAHNAHAMYYLSIAEEAEAEVRAARQVEWLNLLDQEYDNVRAALSWLLEQNNIELSLRICAALRSFWIIRDRRGEGYQWIEKALAKGDGEQITQSIRAKACYAAGVLADSLGQYQRGVERLNESLTLYQELNDQSGVAAALNTLGHAYARNVTAEAHDLYERSLALARQQHDRYGVADALASLADEALALGYYANARGLFEESLALYKILGDKRSIAYCLGGLGQAAANEGNHIEACTVTGESGVAARGGRSHWDCFWPDSAGNGDIVLRGPFDCICLITGEPDRLRGIGQSERNCSLSGYPWRDGAATKKRGWAGAGLTGRKPGYLS
ncbi:MAG TPA: NB-ARC domain-containing protein [Ktedonobacteraceae bacterium]|nr:NB-ARC domain-containing protein [Ktedonobacteraceae bacterium]